MKKKLLFVSMLLALPMLLNAQSAIDAFQFSQPDMKGTARFMSMGGAFGALGGDMTTLSYNPAGIGVYRSSEIGATVNFDIQHSSTESNGYKVTGNEFKFLLNNAGYIGSLKLNNDVMPFFNFGFTYNKSSSFNRVYGGHIGNIGNSMSNYIAGIANSNNLTVGDLTTVDGYDPYNPGPDDYNSPWLAILGYDSYLINPSNKDGKTEWNGIYGNGTTGDAEFINIEEGCVDEYNISFGGNFANIVYWGMDFGITNLRYHLTSLYSEQLTNAYVKNENHISPNASADWSLANNYYVKGSGFNYKLGVIVRPINEFRFGIAFHTPTWYNMNEYFYGATTYKYEGVDIRPGGAITNNGYDGYNDYRFSTPWRLIVSAATVLSNKLIVSADYEWTGYQGMNFSSHYENGYGYGNDMFMDTYYYENKDIDDYYQSTNTFRIGAEYRVTPQFSVRAGYSNVSSPVKNNVKDGQTIVYTAGTRPSFTLDNSTNYVTFGLGYKYKKFYIDGAYVYKHRSSEWSAFTSDPSQGINYTPIAEVSSFDHQIVLSMGFKF